MAERTPLSRRVVLGSLGIGAAAMLLLTAAEAVRFFTTMVPDAGALFTTSGTPRTFSDSLLLSLFFAVIAVGAAGVFQLWNTGVGNVMLRIWAIMAGVVVAAPLFWHLMAVENVLLGVTNSDGAIPADAVIDDPLHGSVLAVSSLLMLLLFVVWLMNIIIFIWFAIERGRARRRREAALREAGAFRG